MTLMEGAGLSVRVDVSGNIIGRRDAMLTAARLVIEVNDVALDTPGRQVSTVGRIRAYPGAPNVIPGA